LSTNKTSELVIGFSDGLILSAVILISTYLLSLNFVDSSRIVVFCLAGGSIILGTAAYYSSRYRKDRMKEKNEEESGREKALELKKTISLFKNIGLGEEMQSDAAAEINKESKEWQEYLALHAGEPDMKRIQNPMVSLLMIILSFWVGGIIPLLTGKLVFPLQQGLILFFIIHIIILFVFGLLKSIVNSEPKLWGALRLALLGLGCMLASYFVTGVFAH
jgi:VIT1/CCC1 family predicted Fe2+/Mn2+ transporter